VIGKGGYGGGSRGRGLYNNNTTRQIVDRGGHFTFKILNISKHLFNMLSIVVHRYPTMRDTFATHSRHIVDTFLTLLRHICYASAPLRCGVAVCCV